MADFPDSDRRGYWQYSWPFMRQWNQSLFSLVFSAWGTAGLVAPWLAGSIHDHTGEFNLAITIALLATIASAATLLMLRMTQQESH